MADSSFFSEENRQAAHILEKMQTLHPLIDCITNNVTIGDVANGLLAVDARPVMASAPEEIAFFVARANALLINLGATNSEQRQAMHLGAGEANHLLKPVIIDPVGIGTSPLRHRLLLELLSENKIAVIRGNISEIKALAGVQTAAGGVDASPKDFSGPKAFQEALEMAEGLAKTHATTIAISGARDIITDGATTYVVNGGNDMMTRVTGSGCTLTGIVAAFVAATPEKAAMATAAAIGMMCLAGDLALEKTGRKQAGSFRVAMFDALSAITPEDLAKRLSVEKMEDDIHD